MGPSDPSHSLRIDLHAHSSVSDGTETPAELVRQAQDAGLDVIAITDHDTTDGWAEARRAAERLGQGLVPGIEISTAHFGVSVHLLAYLPDPEHPELVAELAKIRAARRTRAQRTVERLNERFELSWQEVQAEAGEGATIGRPHIADALVRRGYVQDRGEAFDTVLDFRAGYVAGYYSPDPLQAIALVRRAGGVPVIAHPAANRHGASPPPAVLAAMAEAGLFGLEVLHPENKEPGLSTLLASAADYGLEITGGSDWHGTGKTNHLGQRLTSPEVFGRLLEQATGSVAVLPGRA